MIYTYTYIYISLIEQLHKLTINRFINNNIALTLLYVEQNLNNYIEIMLDCVIPLNSA